MLGTALPDNFKDQFAPFRHFGCDFKDQYNGTLFRFPLRTTSLARRSEISKKSYTISDIQKNLNDLLPQLPNHLLFLRSVKTIEIYSSKNGQKACLLHKATSSLTEREGQNDQFLLQYFDKKSNFPRETFYEKLLATPEKRLPTQSYKLKVCVDSYDSAVEDKLKVIREKKRSDVRETVESDVCDTAKDFTEMESEDSRVKEDLPNIGQRDIDLEEKRRKENGVVQSTIVDSQEIVEYLVVSGLMGGEARRLSCEETSRHLKLVPLGAVAACISKKNAKSGIHSESTGLGSGLGLGIGTGTGTGIWTGTGTGIGAGPGTGMGTGTGTGSCFPQISGQAFCFLPLPVRTQLPVHTNAYWELSANRRDIWR